MFLDILEFEEKKRKHFFSKTVLKLWSQICGEKIPNVQKTTSRKMFKNEKQQKTKNHKNVHNLWLLIRTKIGCFVNF